MHVSCALAAVILIAGELALFIAILRRHGPIAREIGRIARQRYPHLLVGVDTRMARGESILGIRTEVTEYRHQLEHRASGDRELSMFLETDNRIRWYARGCVVLIITTIVLAAMRCVFWT
jgi:hypothetical protein